jgi:hypothetical protein
MIFTTLNFNSFYYEQLKVMLTSLSINSPNDSASIELIDFPNDEVIELKSKFFRYKFTESNLPKNVRDVKGYMVCRRGYVINHAVSIHPKIAWFDTDLIIRKPLDTLWESLQFDSLHILTRKENPPHTRFQAGVFFLNSGPKIISFIQEWNSFISSHFGWYVDQEYLYKISEQKKINRINLNKTYNDVGCSKNACFLDESHIWHSKKHHFRNPKFQKEYQNYLNIYNERNSIH